MLFLLRELRENIKGYWHEEENKRQAFMLKLATNLVYFTPTNRVTFLQ